MIRRAPGSNSPESSAARRRRRRLSPECRWRARAWPAVVCAGLLDLWDDLRVQYRRCRGSVARWARDVPEAGNAHTGEELVLGVSALLDVPEIDVFRHAWRRWFGGDTEPRVESPFLRYMFLGEVPHWVRDYCRQVLAADRAGTLVATRFGVVPARHRRVRLGLLLALLLLITFILLVLLADGAGSLIPGLDGCISPPCY